MSEYFAVRANCGHAFLSGHHGATAVRCLHCEQKENETLRARLASREAALRNARTVIESLSTLAESRTRALFIADAISAIDAELGQ